MRVTERERLERFVRLSIRSAREESRLMYKKVITICLVVTAFTALAVSASASAASPLLTNASGTAVVVGTNLAGTNVGSFKFISPAATIECPKDVLTGTVAANPNNGNPVEANIHSASFLGTEAEENCKSGLGRVQVTTSFAAGGNGLPWCLSFRASDVAQIRGAACGSAVRPITLQMDIHNILGVIKCHFERTAAKGPITGTYNTKADLTVEVRSGANSEFVGTSGGLCPTSLTLEGKLGLTEDPSGTITMD